MKKLPVPAKKKRPADSIMRTHSVMQDIVAATNRPIKPPKLYCVSYQSGNILMKSPQMPRKTAIEFIASVGGNRLREVFENQQPATGEITLELLQEAKLFSK